MPVLFEQFLENLATSGLVSDTQIAAAIESLSPTDRTNSHSLAECLVRRGRLTNYQAKALYHGHTISLVLGEYLLLERVGKGGMGRVFKARHRKLDRVVALKILDRKLAAQPDFVKRFHREMRVVARLSHPNIVHAYDAGQHRRRLFLAMEFVHGVDLGALLKSQGPFPVQTVLDYVLQTARGLEYAHGEGVVHRDLKPANLMLDRNGVVKILDFGLATTEQSSATTSHLTQTGDVMGSVDFMSPEQLSSSHLADHRSDIYSLGCVMYLLLMAKPMYAGASVTTKLAGHMHGEVPSLRPALPESLEPLDRVYQRMVAKDPADRYQSMSEVTRELESLTDQGGGLIKSEPTIAMQAAGLESPSDSDASTRSEFTFDEDTPRTSASDVLTVIERERRMEVDEEEPRSNRRLIAGTVLGLLTTILAAVFIWRPWVRPVPDIVPARSAAAASTDRPPPEGEGPSQTPAGVPGDVPRSTPSVDEVKAAMRRATGYYHDRVATHGGYVYYYSTDLTRRLADGPATKDQIWVQPPATPTVGLAFLAAYRATGDKFYLQAATDAAEALVYGQLDSGGWTKCVDFAPDGRQSAQYRNGKGHGRNYSSLDNGQTQSVIRLLMQVDAAQGFENSRIHEAAQFALITLLDAQFQNGGFPQGWTGPTVAHPSLPASYPDYDWTTEGRVKDYWNLYTINDNVCGHMAQTLIEAYQVYDDPRFLEALRHLGEFLILAQLPDPQRGWAQQYDFEMHPAWALDFEPPAVASAETQDVIETLMEISVATGERRFLAPIPEALQWLRSSVRPDGKLARFYELRTNKPLYVSRRGTEYALTYDDTDLWDEYDWAVDSRVDELERRFQALNLGINVRRKPSAPAEQVRTVIDSLDQDGRWLQKYAGERLLREARFEQGEEYLSTEVFSRNLTLLSDYLQAAPGADSTDKPPLLVYVLAGQSNMGGVAHVVDLEHLAVDPDQPETFRQLKAGDGEWVTRNDVWIVNMTDYLHNQGPLTVGFGENQGQFGPELGFGNVIGDARDEPVLIIKVTQGPMSLAEEGRPPSSGGEVGSYYWRLVSIVDAVLHDVDGVFPELGGFRPRLAGFVWFQGWNDWLTAERISEYDNNLANFIRDLRTAWDAPDLPVVIGEFGQHGPLDANARLSDPQRRAVDMRARQQAVAGLPEFQGNVVFAETTSFVRDGPGGMFLYYKNAGTFYRIGEAFGHAMLELQQKSQVSESPPVDLGQSRL